MYVYMYIRERALINTNLRARTDTSYASTFAHARTYQNQLARRHRSGSAGDDGSKLAAKPM